MNEKEFPKIDDDRLLAEATEIFTKAMEIEIRTSSVIGKCRAPHHEIKEFLTKFGKDVPMLPFSKFIIDAFEKMKLGRSQLIDWKPLAYVFAVKDSPVCTLYPEIISGKVCHTTVETIQSLFSKAFKLSCDVEETACVKEGVEECRFKVSLQPLSVFQAIFDSIDADILVEFQKRASLSTDSKKMYQYLGADAKGMFEKQITDISKKLKIPKEEVSSRINILKEYGHLGKDYEITDMGKEFLKYLNNAEKMDAEFKSGAEHKTKELLSEKMDSVFGKGD
jgi:predicted hydrocarbon binding protein